MNNRLTGSCKNVMSSGRMTDYRANCTLNEELKAMSGAISSSEYRNYLQKNACKVMDVMRKRTDELSANPTGCKCECIKGFNHSPHDRASQVKYSWTPSPGFLAEKNKDFNRFLPAPGAGNWTNYC